MAVPIRTAVATLCAGLVATLLTTVPARAEQDLGSRDHVWAVSAEPRAPRAQISLDDTTGTLSLAVSRDGRAVIEPWAVAIVTEQADLSRDLRFLHRKDRL